MNYIGNKKCLFDRGNKCYALKMKKCFKCKFFIEDNEKNRNTYINKIKEDIKKYAQSHS